MTVVLLKKSGSQKDGKRSIIHENRKKWQILKVSLYFCFKSQRAFVPHLEMDVEGYILDRVFWSGQHLGGAGCGRLQLELVSDSSPFAGVFPCYETIHLSH